MPKKWREIGGFKQATPIKINEEKGQLTEGVYDGHQEHVGENDSMVHYISIDGELCQFWGTTQLDAKLVTVPNGTEIKMTYNGVVKSSKPGRKGFHDFKIEVAEESDEEESKSTPKITKPAKRTAPVKEADTEDGEGDKDIPF